MSATYSDQAAERALLGACLVFDAAIDESSAILYWEDFAKIEHKRIYAAIVEQHELGQRVDIVTVARACPDVDPNYLHELQNSDAWSVGNVSRYADTIVDWRLRRDLVHAAAEITKMANGTGVVYDAGEAADRAREILSELDTPVGKGAPDPDVDSFIANTPTDYDWLIPQFLERKDRLIITAGEGGGKSVLLAQIAVMAAAGIHPWTYEPIKPCNVTVIDLENPARLVTRRFAWIRKNAPDMDPQRLRIHSRTSGIDLTSRTDRRWLIERCRSNAADMLVIGPLYRMSSGVAAKGDTGGEDQARQVTKALDEVRHRCDVALVMETHAPHGNGFGRDLRPFGSSLWLRWPEFGIGLRSDGDKHNRYEVLHWRGARDQRLWPDYVEKEAGRWPWTPTLPQTYRKGAA